MNFTSSLYGNFNITGEYLGDGILPFKNIDPATDISYEGSSYLFEVPIVSHAYSIVLSYGEYLMSLVVGGLHSNIAPINIPIFSNFSQVEVSGKISAESYEPTKVFLSTGFNNLTSPIFKTSTTNFGSFTLGINPGLYTAYTNRVNWASAVQNLAVDSSEIDLNFIIFPLSLNRGFITTMTSNNSELHVEFNLSQNSSCKIDLKFPRCGGTKIIYVEHGEIMATAQISASQYLVYAKSENFSNDFAAFYTKNMEFPIVRLQGKEGEKGVWMLYCLNGRQGVSSLKVLDLYVDEEQFNSTRICERFYGEETWTSDEINKGQILVT